MQHWLFKSEPDSWSWADQVAAGAKGTSWNGSAIIWPSST